MLSPSYRVIDVTSSGNGETTINVDLQETMTICHYRIRNA